MADSGFSRPPLPQLIATIRSDLLTRFNEDVVLRRLDAEVYARVQAAAVHTLYGYIDYLARNMLPDQADPDWLVRHGAMKRCPGNRQQRRQALSAGRMLAAHLNYRPERCCSAMISRRTPPPKPPGRPAECCAPLYWLTPPGERVTLMMALLFAW